MKAAEKLRDNPDLQARALELCRRDPVHFINQFAWTHDPRLKSRQDLPSVIPFVLFDFQVDFVRWLEQRLEDREGGVVEKSRSMGFTWTAAAFAVWLWLFREGVSIGFGSRKEDSVDRRDDPDSIFEKIRTIIDRLPPFLQPEGWDRDGPYDNHMRIVNPENGSIIRGEAGDNVGRGGKALLYIWDEVAFHDGAEGVDSSLSMNTEIVIYGSTPNGVGNLYYQKRFSGAWPVFVMDWRDDPRKTEQWREEYKRKYGKAACAREIDRDYESSVDQILIPASWVRAAKSYRPEESGFSTRYAGLDVADGGADETVFVSRTGPQVEAIYDRDAYEDDDENPLKTARWAAGKCDLEGVDELYVDEIGIGSGVVGELGDKSREFDFEGVNYGESPTDRMIDGRDAREKFDNLKAELHWNLRERFRRTYEHVEGDREHETRDLIALVEHETLERECSTPRWETNSKGRISIESKESIKDRLGAGASPDYLDALVLAFAADALQTKIRIGRA